MTIEERLRALLLNNTDFALLQVPVFASEAPQNTQAPYVVYELVSNEDPLSSYASPYFTTVTRRYQFSIITNKLIQAENIANSVIKALCDAPDSSGQIQTIIPDLEGVRKDTDTQRFLRTIDFFVTAERF